MSLYAKELLRPELQLTLTRPRPGEEVTHRKDGVNLRARVQEGDPEQNLILFDGDTIRVPKEITVDVIGEVESPGALQTPAGIPLVQSVLAAGGEQ